MDGRTHIFDSTMGLPGDGNWLDRKMLRRELTDHLKKQSIDERTQKATSAAQSFLDDLSRRAQVREEIERKSERLKRQQEELLRQQAEQYRQKLRNKLRPEQLD